MFAATLHYRFAGLDVSAKHLRCFDFWVGHKSLKSVIIKMEWTEDVVINFIEIYRGKEILWNTKHPFYYNKIKKNDAWEDVAKSVVSATVDECKKKMNALLSALRREKAKIKKSKGTGTGRSDVYESSWFAFKSLLFLWDKNKVRNTQSSIDKETDESDDVDDDTPDNPAFHDMNQYSEVPKETNDTQEPHETEEAHVTQEPHVTQETENNPIIRVSRKGKQPLLMTPSTSKKRRADEKLDAAFQILTKASEASQGDPNESVLFGNLVGKKLQKYSNVAQTAVQEAIMNILFAADRGYYNQKKSPQRHLQSGNNSTHQNSLFVQHHSVHQGTQFSQSQYSAPPADHWNSSMPNYFTTAALSEAPQSSTVGLPLSSPTTSHSSDIANYSTSTSPSVFELTELP